MRRRKETAVPARAAGPALRIRSASKDPEAPAGTSAADFFVDFSAKDTSSRCDPFPIPRCETPSDSASDLGLETNQTRELPPPPPRGSANRNSDPCVRDLTVGRGKMFQIFRSFPTQMDYKGQKLAEQIFQGIILVSAVIGFIYGYITEQFGWTVYIVMAGFALSCLLTLPPWPMYRRNPLKWLPVQESATDDKKPADRKVKRHPKN